MGQPAEPVVWRGFYFSFSLCGQPVLFAQTRRRPAKLFWGQKNAAPDRIFRNFKSLKIVPLSFPNYKKFVYCEALKLWSVRSGVCCRMLKPKVSNFKASLKPILKINNGYGIIPKFNDHLLAVESLFSQLDFKSVRSMLQTFFASRLTSSPGFLDAPKSSSSDYKLISANELIQ